MPALSPTFPIIIEKKPLISGIEVMPHWGTMIFETQKRPDHDALIFNMLILQYEKGFYFKKSPSIDK
jgi:hypothetical protein